MSSKLAQVKLSRSHWDAVSLKIEQNRIIVQNIVLQKHTDGLDWLAAGCIVPFGFNCYI